MRKTPALTATRVFDVLFRSVSLEHTLPLRTVAPIPKPKKVAAGVHLRPVYAKPRTLQAPPMKRDASWAEPNHVEPSAWNNGQVCAGVESLTRSSGQAAARVEPSAWNNGQVCAGVESLTRSGGQACATEPPSLEQEGRMSARSAARRALAGACARPMSQRRVRSRGHACREVGSSSGGTSLPRGVADVPLYRGGA